MSVQAVNWALKVKNTGPLPAEARLVLLVMADRADKDGRNVFLAASTIAKTLGTTDRSVRRHFSTLRKRGVIIPGDPDAIPEHYRHDRRPVVYDLPINTSPGAARFMAGLTPPVEWSGDVEDDPWDVPKKPRQNMPPEWMASFGITSRPDSNVIPLRGHGVTAVSARGDSSVRHGVTAVSSNPVCNPSTIPTSLKSSFLLTLVARTIDALDLGHLRDGMNDATRWRFA